MSLDRTLRTRNALARHRNVLSRAERILALQDDEKWYEESSTFGLPKVAHRKSTTGNKKKKAAAAEAVETESAEQPATEE
jgi:small basic protein (TIGR04137 family)